MSAVELSLTDIMRQDRGGRLGPVQAAASSARCAPHVEAGKLSEKTLHAELGEIVAGLKPGRESDDETILFWHRGLSLSDIALGHAMLEKGSAPRHRPAAAVSLNPLPLGEGKAHAMTEIEIGSRPLTIGALHAASAPSTRIHLSAEARARVAAARAVVERYAQGSEPIYGLNTGLGGNVGYRLDPAEMEAFQVAARARHRCRRAVPGTGRAHRPPLPHRRPRPGRRWISPEVLDRLVAMFNAGVIPVVPLRGSIGRGISGFARISPPPPSDCGEAFFEGRRMPGAEALGEAGLAPAVLKPKDGLSLCNASAVSCAHAVHVLAELADLLVVSVVTAALAGEGYAANPAIFDARLAAARPTRGQELAAAMFRAVLSGSYLYDAEAPRSIQDALSFRVLSPLYGPVLEAFRTAVEDLETEINSAADNPLVLAEDGLILSTANFHTPAIALAFDTLAIALTQLSTAGFYRIAKLMNAQLSGLPKYLSPVGGASNGLNSLQKTAAGLHAEIRLNATPASLDALPVSEAVEDHAPQTPLAIRKLAAQLEPLWLLLAIEALTAAQAVDLRGKPRLAAVTAQLYEAIRAEVPAMMEDRETGRDVMLVLGVLRAPALVSRLREPFTELGVPIVFEP